MAGWFDDNSPDQQDWFSANAPIPTLQAQVITPSEGGGLDLQRMKAGLPPNQPFPEAPASGLAPYIVGATEAAVPQSLDDLVRMAILPRAEPVDLERENQLASEWRGEQGPEAQARSITGTLMAAAPLAHIPFGEEVPPPLRTEPLAPEPPPTQSMGPGTTAGDVSNALDWTPQSPPITPLEEAVSKVQPPGPYTSPETGFTHYPGLEGHQPVPSDWAYPVPPPGTPLEPKPFLGPNGSTPAADAAQAQPQPQGVQQPGPAGFTARKPWEVPPGDEPYAGVTPQMGTQEAPIGAANRIASAREQAGLTEAPPSGIGQSWHESVAQGNALIDKGADAYKVVSDFTKTGDISGQKMSVARAWLERLQRANQEARGALEQDPTNPALQQKALDAETAEGAYWQGYQPMKTEWSRIGTGMQEGRGITDADLLSQKTAEQTMREAIDRELTDSDKVRAAKAVSNTRAANARSDAAFDKAIGEATRKAKGPPRSLEQLKNDLAAKLKELTPC